MPILLTKLQHSLFLGSLSGFCALGVVFCALSAGATEPVVPWECSVFGGEAQDRCIRIYAEIQQEKIAKLEKELEAHQQRVQQLQEQVSEQASTTAELERQLSYNRSRWYESPSVEVYPPFGLNLRFGRDRFWRGSLWYGVPRYFGPRWYGHGHRRWHRHH